MGYSRGKTYFAATQTLEAFIRNSAGGRAVYYWTLTIAHNETDKATAESMLKPLKDLIRARSGHIAGVWERQERGAWHTHFVTDVYLDVNVLRPFLVERGWGPQMKVRRLQTVMRCVDGQYVADVGNLKRLIRYLAKYVCKALTDDQGERVRPFFCSQAVKKATVRFAWTKEVNPSSYLYYWGKQLFLTLYGRLPKFHELEHVMRLGVEETDWLSFDPFCLWALWPEPG